MIYAVEAQSGSAHRGPLALTHTTSQIVGVLDQVGGHRPPSSRRIRNFYSNFLHRYINTITRWEQLKKEGWKFTIVNLR